MSAAEEQTVHIGFVARAAAARLETPAARLWVERNFVRFVRSGKELPAFPARVERELGGPPSGTVSWAAFGRRLAAVVEARRLSAARTARISVPQAVGMLDLDLRKRANRARRLGIAEAIRQARQAEPVWKWIPADRRVRATIAIGSLRFDVEFHGGGNHGGWMFGWAPARETAAAISMYGRPTGLFAKVDRCLREIVADFLVKVAPQSVFAVGADVRRSRYLAAAFRDLPPGYALKVFEDPDTGEPREIEIDAQAPVPRRLMHAMEIHALLTGADAAPVAPAAEDEEFDLAAVLRF